MAPAWHEEIVAAGKAISITRCGDELALMRASRAASVCIVGIGIERLEVSASPVN